MIQVYGGGDYPAYVIDDDTLREELLSEEDTREWLQEVPADPHAPSFWRMLGELDRALETGQARLLEREPGTVKWAVAAARLAHVHHWRGAYADAHDLLDVAEEVLADDPQLLALALQHRAKVLFDEQRYAEAHQAASRALAIRERGADRGLVASTRQVLDRVERELTGQPD